MHATRAVRQITRGIPKSKSSNVALYQLRSSSIAPYCAAGKPFSTFSSRERIEEANFIKREEEIRKNELKKKLEAILALEDDNKHKADVIEMLGMKSESTKEPGFLERNNLNNPFVYGAFAFASLVPLVERGYLYFDEETYVAITFGFAVAFVYSKFGPDIMKSYQAEIDSIKKGLFKADDILKEKIIVEGAAVEGLVGVEKTYAELHELVDDVSVLQAQALNASLDHKYTEAIAKKLDSLVALENAAAASIRQRTLTAVKSTVLDTFKNDKKVKEAALNHALSVLAGGPNTKYGKDIVGETFIAAVKNYKETYSKQAPGTDKIIQNLEKDVAAVLQEPLFEEKGGNVYETHPVSTRYVA